jgi:MoxR-like ATPase
MTMQTLSAEEVAPLREMTRRLVSQVERVIVGKHDLIEMIVIALLARGHVLIEDIPGVGKTTLAKSVAKAIGGTFKRIQFTPDLLPGDVTGLNIYNPKSGEFHFNPGPIFANVVLADEINRATPKTQSALLESMEETQTTTDGTTRALPAPFFVIATQNPIEYRGTYPLPEAQMDRFLMRLSVGYPKQNEEIDMLARHAEAAAAEASEVHPPPPSADAATLHAQGAHVHGAHLNGATSQSASNRVLTREGNFEQALLERVETALSIEDAQAMQRARTRVHVSPSVREYIVTLAAATRNEFDVRLGASPRASLALQRAAQAAALLAGREYVLPDDVKRLAAPVMAHRIILQNNDGKAAEDLIARLLDEVPVAG